MGSVVLAGCSAAWCVWLAAGFSSRDRSALLRDARKLYGGFEQVVGRFAGSRVGGESVSLGQVSEMVDVIRLGLSAGLSFDAALGLYCEQGTGRLAGRMLQARLGWQMGMESREESLMAAARDLRVRQLESFASAVGQAHSLGAPLSETHAHQGTEKRAVIGKPPITSTVASRRSSAQRWSFSSTPPCVMWRSLVRNCGCAA